MLLFIQLCFLSVVQSRCCLFQMQHGAQAWTLPGVCVLSKRCLVCFVSYDKCCSVKECEGGGGRGRREMWPQPGVTLQSAVSSTEQLVQCRQVSVQASGAASLPLLPTLLFFQLDKNCRQIVSYLERRILKHDFLLLVSTVILKDKHVLKLPDNTLFVFIGLGSRISPTRCHKHPVLDRNSSSWAPPVAG